MEKLTMRMVKCVIVTPERAVLDETVDFVAVPMYDGELGVLPGRAPLIGRLGCGELRTLHGNNSKRYFIDGGFVQVRGNTVTVLTSKAMPAEEIQLADAEKTLQETLQPAATPQAREAQAKAQQRARAQVRLARKTAEQADH